ncbi:MAG: 2-oxo acid dehydrogenase subunit E2 [Spirochaetaceae bacterium]|nr:2-oxo acid dehydrogenase subunit E2 [Spirochaetaceae bacterium]MCF7950745.1 2-oxo acid dehydrogenase subunit E2 [Spirochaetaceae bacterium]
MAEKMLMLALSPTMEEGTIVSWSKQEGDKIENGDVVCEVETDKATMDYESMQAGTLLKIVVAEGESAAVEQPIAVVGEEGEDISGLLKEIESQSTGAGKAGEDQTAGKGSAEGAGEASGEEGGRTGAAAGSSEATEEGGGGRDGGRIKASPLARNLAEEAGIDLAALQGQGSGPDGRIVKKDVEAATSAGGLQVSARPAQQAQSAQPTAQPAGEAAAQKAPAPGSGLGTQPPVSSTGIEEQHLKIGRKRAVIAQRLSESKYSAPHYYLTSSLRTDPLTKAREQINQQSIKAGGAKLSLNAFIMKLTAEAIKRHPIVNAAWKEQEIYIPGSIDIGLAVALDDGLITPVVRNCGGKGIRQIDSEVQQLVAKARSGKLSPEEYSGASFSISNLGTYGVEQFTAIINPPASAIMAVGSVTREPVELENGSISFDNKMKLTLSCDHRVIDGAVGAAFLRDLKAMFENPMQALL